MLFLTLIILLSVQKLLKTIGDIESNTLESSESVLIKDNESNVTCKNYLRFRNLSTKWVLER